MLRVGFTHDRASAMERKRANNSESKGLTGEYAGDRRGLRPSTLASKNFNRVTANGAANAMPARLFAVLLFDILELGKMARRVGRIAQMSRRIIRIAES